MAQIALTVVRDDEGCDCRCDPDLMLRVLSNLIDNAIRHTPPHGEVRIELEPVGDRLQISVSDTGAGIPQASIPFLFERYFQIDADGAGKGSAGLGLAIVKRILEAHHTSIEVVSSVDSGTTFRFSLPSYRIPENHHPQPPSAPHA